MQRALAALREQLARRDEVLRAGAHRVRWKILQVPVRLNDDVVAEVAGLGTVQLSCSASRSSGRVCRYS
jgi:hypothetical protein